MDITAFRAAYPEFDEAGDTLVTAKLTDAAGRLSTDAWGDRYDEAHGLMTAHKLVMSPFGRDLRSENGADLLYWPALEQLRFEHLPRAIVP